MTAKPSRFETTMICVIFVMCVGYHLWGVNVGWKSYNLPGLEFRQTQTGLATMYIQRDHDFSLAYPTPVLGKPWSIPMEFPFYQWTVVVVSRLTNLSLTHAARMVSIVCFYLMLPALYALLGLWRVVPVRRLMVLGLVLTAPLYIFYARAFLMETMALMFAVWFWLAYLMAVERRSGWWLAAAMIAGVGAGLVKVTTYLLFLIPPALWSVGRLWRERKGRQWGRELAWMAGAVAVPVAASIWWVKKADAIKALNPMAWFLSSEHLRDFNLGTWATRFSGSMWLTKWHLVTERVTWWPLLAVLAGLGFWRAHHRWREIAVCAGTFVAALAIFPELYTLHDYYYVANTVLLMMAAGLALVGALEGGKSGWFTGMLWVALLSGQALTYHAVYYPAQAAISHGGDGLSHSLSAITQPNDVVVIAGQDWSSITPYYARRRALMLRDEELLAPHSARLNEALNNLKGESIGALVIPAEKRPALDLVADLAPWGIDAQPLYRWRNLLVYVPTSRRGADTEILKNTWFEDVTWAPGAEPPPDNLSASWKEVGSLLPRDRAYFSGMTPMPVRFFCTYGPARDGIEFGAHPWTRLVFQLPAGAHRLTTWLRMPPETYDPNLPRDLTSDGVEAKLEILTSGRPARVLFRRVLNPRDHPSDRGYQAMRIDFDLKEAGEIELSFGPGPAGSSVRDWLRIGRLLIR